MVSETGLTEFVRFIDEALVTPYSMLLQTLSALLLFKQVSLVKVKQLGVVIYGSY